MALGGVELTGNRCCGIELVEEAVVGSGDLARFIEVELVADEFGESDKSILTSIMGDGTLFMDIVATFCAVSEPVEGVLV